MQQANFDNKTYTSGVMDVDKEDLNDVLHVADYVSDLFQHLHSAEENQCPGMYMHNQTDINAKVSAHLMRAHLMRFKRCSQNAVFIEPHSPFTIHYSPIQPTHLSHFCRFVLQLTPDACHSG